MEDRYVVRKEDGKFWVFDTFTSAGFRSPDGYDVESHAQDVADVFNKEHQCMTDLQVRKDPASEYYRVEYLMEPFGTEHERRMFRSTLSFKTRSKTQDIVFGIFLGWGLDVDRARWMASTKMRSAGTV